MTNQNSNYFNTSLKSANESKLWFALLRDSNRVKSGDVDWFLKGLDEISNIFAPSTLALKGKNRFAFSYVILLFNF
jgi:hypothetical protein